MALNTFDGALHRSHADETARLAATSTPFVLSSAAQMLLASLAAAAGVIHLVMVPSHIGEGTLEGVLFAVTGWFQLALALMLIRRPSAPMLIVGIAASAAFIAAWVMSRTTGLPFGQHAWHAEAVTFIDLTAVALETAFVASAALSLWKPSLGAALEGRGELFAWQAPVAILVVTTMALASPSARDHAAGTHGVHGHGDDKGVSLLMNGHTHGATEMVKLDAATQAEFDAQLDITRDVAAQYATVAAAEAAGFQRAGPFSPGLGAHYVRIGDAELNVDGVVDDNDLRHPQSIVYAGTDPDSEIVGFMYYSMSATEPVGFVGPNDKWHYHENICLKWLPDGRVDAPFGMDNEATEAQCAAAGGEILKSTSWMVHVWTAPGYDNVEGGVFAELNPGVTCADGTYYRLPIDEWAAHPLNVCRDAAGG